MDREDLQRLRIDRAPSAPAVKRAPRQLATWIVWVSFVGAVVAARTFTRSDVEVQTARATADASAEQPTALSATGYIVAHHKIAVNSKVTGRVKWIGVEKGDPVKAGQVLVELEHQEFVAQRAQAEGQVQSARAMLQELVTGSRPQEVEQARNALEESRAVLRNDEVTLDRTQQLSRAGLVPRQQLDEAQSRHDADGQKVAALTQAYTLAKLGPRREEVQRARGALLQAQGQLAYADAQLAATKIRAPISGTILERTAEPGELVTSTFASAAAGGPVGSVVTLADLHDLQVELDIAQDEFAKLHPNQRGTVTTDAYPDHEYAGVLAEIAPEANRQKATVQVKVTITDPDEHLRPDMNATVRFLSDGPTTATTANGVALPVKAVRTAQGRDIVFVARDGRAIARSIKVLRTHGTEAIVLGVADGEHVIIDPPPSVKDGVKIQERR